MTSVELRELGEGETARAAAALLELRPAYLDADTIAARADALRAAGYRLVAVLEDGEHEAAAAAGFRVGESLGWGRYLYVDDLVTRAERRGRGHGAQLMRWLEQEARRLACHSLHLDSGVGPERADAHRLYLGQRMLISSHHFAKDLGG